VSDPHENVVVSALTAEYRRIEARLEGATKRLDHAHKQVEIEGAMIKQSIADLLAIEDAIIHAGGEVPKKPELAEGEEPYSDGEAP
jgi:hypothetical protein